MAKGCRGGWRRGKINTRVWCFCPHLLSALGINVCNTTVTPERAASTSWLDLCLTSTWFTKYWRSSVNLSINPRLSDCFSNTKHQYFSRDLHFISFQRTLVLCGTLVSLKEILTKHFISKVKLKSPSRSFILIKWLPLYHFKKKVANWKNLKDCCLKSKIYKRRFKTAFVQNFALEGWLFVYIFIDCVPF